MYQVVSKIDTVAYVTGRRDGTLTSFDLKMSQRGLGSDDRIDEVDETLDIVLANWKATDLDPLKSVQSLDELEGNLSVDLYNGLSRLPAATLTDRDFWRYCSCYLYDFIVWRQPSKSVTALLPYFGAASNGLGRECVPHRMFGRAHIARVGGEANGDNEPFALARFGASDVWKSHILRVANGNAPVVVREMLTDVKSGRLKTDVVRPFVKNLRRVRANVLFEVLDQHQARELVDRERARTLASARSLDNDTPSD